MNIFKNVVLQREYKSLVGLSINLEKGELGGFSIEVETNNPIAYESYLYQGRTAEADRESDYQMLKEMLKKPTN
jgi:hypothetical protein